MYNILHGFSHIKRPIQQIWGLRFKLTDRCPRAVDGRVSSRGRVVAHPPQQYKSESLYIPLAVTAGRYARGEAGSRSTVATPRHCCALPHPLPLAPHPHWPCGPCHCPQCSRNRELNIVVMEACPASAPRRPRRQLVCSGAGGCSEEPPPRPCRRTGSGRGIRCRAAFLSQNPIVCCCSAGVRCNTSGGCSAFLCAPNGALFLALAVPHATIPWTLLY